MIRRRRGIWRKVLLLFWILVLIYFFFQHFGNSNQIVSSAKRGLPLRRTINNIWTITDSPSLTDVFSFRDLETRLCKVKRHKYTEWRKPIMTRLDACPKKGITSMATMHGHTGNGFPSILIIIQTTLNVSSNV